MSANDNEAVLTVMDIARRWRCGRRAVLEHIHRGDLAAWHVGRAWRVARAELERFELTRRVA